MKTVILTLFAASVAAERCPAGVVLQDYTDDKCKEKDTDPGKSVEI